MHLVRDTRNNGRTARSTVIETDYLVIGAGAAGMAFTDALVADSDAEVVMVDRRHCPGGHWNDAYPFVRLHQPAAYYGVNSRSLGSDTIDETGENAGMYERATAAQICDYYQRVLEEHLVPSGQVRFFAMSDYLGGDLDDGSAFQPTDGLGEHGFVSRLTGATTTVAVRKKLVDARYLEPVIPLNHTPSFEIDPDATFIPVNGLAKMPEAANGYTIVGSGKTAIDACADAEGIDDLFARLEASGQFRRIDPTVKPTMFRSATVSTSELEAVRTIENVVRLGHVRHIGPDAISMEHGEIATDRNQVHVDCSAPGLRPTKSRPVFEGGHITLQPIRTVVPPFNAALTGYIETSRDDDREKRRLCPTNPYPNRAVDWIPNMRITLEAMDVWNGQPDVTAWLERSRTNIARGMFDYADDPRMQTALTRQITNSAPAIAKLKKLEANPDFVTT